MNQTLVTIKKPMDTNANQTSNKTYGDF